MIYLIGRRLALALLFSIPCLANATLLTYTYTGTITGLDSQIASELGLSGTVDPFYATVEVDSSTPDINPDTTSVGSYEVSVGFVFGDLSVSNVSGGYSVSTFTNLESIAIGASGFSATFGDFTATDVGMSFLFIDQTRVPGPDPFLLSDSLPLEAVDPNYFRLHNWFIDGTFRDAPAHIEGAVGNMRVSASNVPEPSVFWLILPFALWLMQKRFNWRKQSTNLRYSLEQKGLCL